MPPKLKKNYCQKLGGPHDTANKQKGVEEKENKCINFDFRETERSDKILPDENKGEETKKIFKSPSAVKTKPRSLGFWSKKLQDLEENEEKNKKCGLYEFSGTDDSEASFKMNKKSKQKLRLKKKRQPMVPKYYIALENAKKEKKIKKAHKQRSSRQQTLLSKERRNSADIGEKFPTTVETLGITSTPAINADNVIGASNFLFLSPILKTEAEHCSVMECLPPELKVLDGTPVTVHLNRGISRVETKLKRLSCRRVLRSGKMVDT